MVRSSIPWEKVEGRELRISWRQRMRRQGCDTKRRPVWDADLLE